MSLLSKSVVVRVHNYGLKDAKRGFYASTNKDGWDYIKYIEGHAKTLVKDWGVFGEKGFLTDREKKEARQRLRTTGSVLRDIVVSVDGRSVKGFKTPEEWQSLAKGIVQDWAKATGQKVANLDWVGTYHPNTDHDHVHLLLWEKEKSQRLTPKLVNGVLAMDGTSPVFERKSGRHLFWARKLLPQEQLRFFDELVTARTLTLQQDMSSESRIKAREQLRRLAIPRKVKELLHFCPVEKDYWSKDMEQWRGKIDDITDSLLSENKEQMEAYFATRAELRRKDDVLRKLADEKGDTYKGGYEAEFVTEFYGRMGNRILKTARRKLEKSLNSHAKDGRLSRAKMKHINEDISRTVPRFLTTLPRRVFSLSLGEAKSDSIRIFEQYQWSLEKARFEMLVAQGWIDINGNKIEPIYGSKSGAENDPEKGGSSDDFEM